MTNEERAACPPCVVVIISNMISKLGDLKAKAEGSQKLAQMLPEADYTDILSAVTSAESSIDTIIDDFDRANNALAGM